MPVSETVLLRDLLDFQRQDLELVALAQGQDDAYGSDKFLLMTSIHRQIYRRLRQGYAITLQERQVAQDLLACPGSVCLIARIPVLVAPNGR